MVVSGIAFRQTHRVSCWVFSLLSFILFPHVFCKEMDHEEQIKKILKYLKLLNDWEMWVLGESSLFGEFELVPFFGGGELGGSLKEFKIISLFWSLVMA